MSLVVRFERHFQRRGTEAAWASANPVLEAAEFGVVLDGAGNPLAMKMGDGTTAWLSLPYLSSPMVVVAGGTANALTATFDPVPVLYDGLTVPVRAAAANTTAATLAVNGGTARAITKLGGTALAAGDISAAGHELQLQYRASVPRWELLNPKAGSGGGSGDVVGPASSVDGRLALFDGTTGKLLKQGAAPPTGTNTGDETTTTIGALINGATAKTTPANADYFGLMDSAASNVLKKLSWANLVATLTTAFNALYRSVSTAIGTSDLAADAVTYAKIQNVSAASRLLGRGSAGGSGDVEELTLGSGLVMAGTVLSSTGTSAPIALGTSNPGSPSTNDLFYRTDLGYLIYYDGTRWLTLNELDDQFAGTVSVSPLTAVNPIAFSPAETTFQMFVTQVVCKTYVVTSNSGSNYWTVVLDWRTSADVPTTIHSFTTAADTANTSTSHDLAFNATIPTTARHLRLAVTTKTGTPGVIYVWTKLKYRLVIT